MNERRHSISEIEALADRYVEMALAALADPILHDRIKAAEDAEGAGNLLSLITHLRMGHFKEQVMFRFEQAEEEIAALEALKVTGTPTKRVGGDA